MWVRTRDVYRPILDTWLMKPKPIAKSSSQATGQQMSTGEPRIWWNLQNWFVAQHGILFVWNAMPPIQFLSPSRTNQISRFSRTEQVWFCWRLTIFKTTWPKGDRWARTGVGICLLRCFFCPYRFLGLKNFEPQMLFAHLLHPRHEI